MRDVERVLKTCIQCWAHAPNAPRPVPIRSLPRNWASEVVAIYFFGPLPLTPRGNQVILVIIDHFTRWPEAVPLPAASAAGTAEALLRVWIPRHGFFAVLLSDNGTQFTSATFKGMCKQVGISKVYSCPYHPQGNSVVERYMRSLIRILT